MIFHFFKMTKSSFRPRGKESTKVRISQNKGKESENCYQKLKRSLKDRHSDLFNFWQEFLLSFPLFCDKSSFNRTIVDFRKKLANNKSEEI